MADDAEEIMTDLSIAERLFAKALFHSEQDRQDFIGQKARQFEREIASAIRKDKAELHEIAGCVLGFMENETMGFVLLAMDDGDIGAVRSAQLMLQNEFKEAIRRTAETRAVKAVEAMTPEDFKPN
jgi:hypothetical protein